MSAPPAPPADAQPWLTPRNVAVGAAVAGGAALAAYAVHRAMHSDEQPHGAGVESPTDSTVPEDPAVVVQQSKQKGAESPAGGVNKKSSNAKKSPAAQFAALKEAGNKLFKKRMYADAIEMYTQAINDCPKTETADAAYQNRAAAYEKLGMMDKVYDDCSKAVAINARYTKAYARRARAARSLKRYEDAMRDQTVVMMLEGFNQDTTIQSADDLLKEFATMKAKQVVESRGLDHVVPMSTNFVDGYLTSFCEDPILKEAAAAENLGAAGDASEDGGGDEFGAALRRLKAKQYDKVVPACSRYIDGEGERQLEALCLRATFYIIQGSTVRANEDFERLFGLADQLSAEQKEEPRTKAVLSEAHIRRGSYYMQMGDVAESMRHFESAQRLTPDSPDVYHHRGQLRMLVGDLNSAVADFHKCTELRPEYALGRVQAAYADYRKASENAAPASAGRHKALDRLGTVVREFHSCAEGHGLLGQAYLEVGDWQDALDEFDTALKLDERNATMLVHKGMALMQRGDVDGAVSLVQQAADADPHSEFALETLGQIELQRGRPSAAVSHLSRAVELARTEMELTHVIGMCEAAKGQLAAARALGVDPEQAAAMAQAAAHLAAAGTSSA